MSTLKELVELKESYLMVDYQGQAKVEIAKAIALTRIADALEKINEREEAKWKIQPK
jgi:hypothetical protein